MELKAPEKIVRRIAPIDYMERIQSAVSIHYGDEDIATPPEWALEVTEDLRSLGKEVECFHISRPGSLPAGGKRSAFH